MCVCECVCVCVFLYALTCVFFLSRHRSISRTMTGVSRKKSSGLGDSFSEKATTKTQQTFEVQLTIKSGKGLVATDLNGLSDPYCIIKGAKGGIKLQVRGANLCVLRVECVFRT